MPDDPTVSVVVLVLERARLALDCIDALQRPGACPAGTEVIVVANGTPPDQVHLLAALEDTVLVVNEENLGFAGGCTQAVSVARAPYLVFLNDDSRVEEGAVAALVRAVAAEPTIGAVGSCILSTDGTIEEAGSVIWSDGSCTHVGEGQRPDAYREPRDVDYASANGLLVTRRAWDAVGGFDRRYFPAYYEDVDLCLMLAAHGFRVRYEPRARLTHHRSQSTTRLYREFLLDRNQHKLVEKWATSLALFEPKPSRERGPEFEAALRRAIDRPRRVPRAPRPAPDRDAPGSSRADAGPSADRLHEDYVVYLEQRVDRQDRRLTDLESYVSGLWGVRFRRWVAGRLQRLRRR